MTLRRPPPSLERLLDNNAPIKIRNLCFFSVGPGDTALERASERARKRMGERTRERTRERTTGWSDIIE